MIFSRVLLKIGKIIHQKSIQCYKNDYKKLQYLRNQTVVVIFPISRIPPMMITGITAPAKIAVKPMILYHAATELSDSATNSVRFENDKKLRRI